MTENEYVQLKEQVDKALAAKDVELAIDIYTKALEKNPNNIDIIVDTGKLYSNLQQYTLAEEYYSKAYGLDEKSFKVNHNRALNFYRQELYSDAIIYFDKALLIQPDSYITLNSLGNLYSKLGKDDEAVSIYNHAITLQPHNFIAAYNLAKHYSKLDDWNYTLQNILPYQDKIPSKNAEDFYLLVGRAYYGLDDYENTIKYYLKLHEIRPDWPGYLLVLGESYRFSGKHLKAISYYTKFLEAKPDNTEVVRRLAWCKYHQKNKLEAAHYILNFQTLPI